MAEPRKIPKQARSVVMVETILEAAARILEDDGIAQFNTNRIAQRAGISVGSLYQYFPSKDAIIAELIRIEHVQLLEDLKAMTAQLGDAPLQIAVREVVRVGVEGQLRRPALSRSLDYLEPGQSAQGAGEAVEAEIRALVVGLLAPRLPRLRGKALTTAAADLAAMSRGMIDAAGFRGETGQAPLVERVTRAALGYLAPWL